MAFRLQLPLNPIFLVPVCFISLILLLVMLVPSDLQEQLFLSRTDFQAYTLLTAPLVHHSWAHLALNLGGVWLWWALFAESIPHARGWLVLPLVMVVSSFAELTFNASFNQYAGFSAMLYALFTYSATYEVRQGKLVGGVILLAVLIKLVVDLTFPAQAAGLAVAAHTSGAATGLLIALIRPRTKRKSVR